MSDAVLEASPLVESRTHTDPALGKLTDQWRETGEQKDRMMSGGVKEKLF